MTQTNEQRMEIVKGYPPNIDQITKAFPQSRRPGIIFAYGDKIYVPSGNDLSEHLKVHEAVHGIRQQRLGVELWWNKYIEDRSFRFNEELLAHRAEYASMIKDTPNRKQRRLALKAVASRLASPLYGCGGGWKKAAELILAGIDKEGRAK